MLWGYSNSNVKSKVQGQVFITQTWTYIFLLELAQEQNMGIIFFARSKLEIKTMKKHF
jgi:hypothetical protein